MDTQSVQHESDVIEQVATLLFDVLVEQEISLTDIVAECFGGGERPNGYLDDRWKERHAESEGLVGEQSLEQQETLNEIMRELNKEHYFQ